MLKQLFFCLHFILCLQNVFPCALFSEVVCSAKTKTYNSIYIGAFFQPSINHSHESGRAGDRERFCWLRSNLIKTILLEINNFNNIYWMMKATSSDSLPEGSKPKVTRQIWGVVRYQQESTNTNPINIFTDFSNVWLYSCENNGQLTFSGQIKKNLHRIAENIWNIKEMGLKPVSVLGTYMKNYERIL